VRLLDFSEDDQWWYFRLGPVEGSDILRSEGVLPAGRGLPETGVWNIQLARLKGLIDPYDRQYFPDRDHLWAIRKSKQNRQMLVHIFSNAEQCIRILELSEKLPGFA
jgi:hypothetical protein